MPTFTALTTLPGKSAADGLGEAMQRLNPEPTGIGVLEVEDGSGRYEVGGYFTGPPDPVALALIAAAFGARPFVVSQLPETDWVSHVRRDLAPVRAGRFFVYGSHDAAKLPKDAVPLLIEAAMAFGTGHHGTTLGCLRALDRLISDGFVPARVADIGCGTAVLAMAAARVWGGAADRRCTIIAGDIDPVAIEVARANLVANAMADRVKCVVAAGFAHHALQRSGPYDLIFANILKGPLISLAPEVAARLSRGGFAVISGVLNQQAQEIAEVYARSGISQVRSARIGDWTTLVLRMMS